MTYSDLDKRRANARAYLKRNPEYAEKARERSRIAQAAKRANDLIGVVVVVYLRRRLYTGKFFADYTSVPVEMRYTKKEVA